MSDTTNTPTIAIVRINTVKPDFKSGNMGGKWFSLVCYAIWNFEAADIVAALAHYNRGTTYGYINEDGHLTRETTVDPEPTFEVAPDADPLTGIAYGDLT